MELKLTKETLRFERPVSRGEEQVTIEGEATLPGSMRDAVTVLSVQAQAYLGDMQAGSGEAAVRGRVCFQVLYTQGDLTRIRTLETCCDFTHTVKLAGVTPAMRLHASAAVQETEGMAASGRMTLRALLGIALEAYDVAEREVVTQAQDAQGEAARETENLQTRMQTVCFCLSEQLGTGKTLVREEFDLPAKLEVADVLSATATASASEISGGNGRLSVSGVVEVRVLHRPAQAGRPLVTTVHELPFDVSIDAKLEEGEQPEMTAEVTDVMADSVAGDRGRTLRVEAEIRVGLSLCRQHEKTLLEDLYTLEGPALEPQREEIQVHAARMHAQARESLRMQVTLPADAPAIDTVTAVFAQPALTAVSPAGRRLNAEGIMSVTMIYLPVDSDIPISVHTREPFAMTFPIEMQGEVSAVAYVMETTVGATTSDRAELRCVLKLDAQQCSVRTVHLVRDVEAHESEAPEHGFVMVWPAVGESRWDTARRLRVAEGSLRPAGKTALLAFRK